MEEPREIRQEIDRILGRSIAEEEEEAEMRSMTEIRKLKKAAHTSMEFTGCSLEAYEYNLFAAERWMDNMRTYAALVKNEIDKRKQSE